MIISIWTSYLQMPTDLVRGVGAAGVFIVWILKYHDYRLELSISEPGQIIWQNTPNKHVLMYESHVVTQNMEKKQGI